MAILTENGLVIRRYPEIFNRIKDVIRAEISADIVFDDDTVIGQITKIISREMALLEETLQLLNDGWDKDKAEGEALDRVLALVGISRRQASKSSGLVLFECSPETRVNRGTILQNPTTRDMFVTTSSVKAELGSCQSAILSLTPPEEGMMYSLSIGNNTYTYQATLGDDEEDVINYFVSTLNGLDAGFEAGVVEDEKIEISTTTLGDINIALLSNFLANTVYVNVPTEAQEFGEIRAPKNSITQLLSGAGGVFSVTNAQEFGLGRDRETDSEFLQRSKSSLAVRGKSTYNAMLTAIEDIPFVSNVLLVENTEPYVVDNIPANSFEVVLDAADTEENNRIIAETIWDNKPLGITAYGEIDPPITVYDVGGNPRQVSFTRPTPIWIGVKVLYEEYAEEPLTEQLAQSIKEAVMEYSVVFKTGVDVIPRRFLGSIYARTSGLGNVTVEVEKLASENSPVVNTTENPIAISNRQRATFKIENIIVEAV